MASWSTGAYDHAGRNLSISLAHVSILDMEMLIILGLAVVGLALLGVTYKFRRDALINARKARVAGQYKGSEDTLPAQFTDLSGMA